MSEDNFDKNKNTERKNRDPKNEFFKKKFSIAYPNTKEGREKLFLEFKKREREFKIGSQMLIEENSPLIDRMHVYEMFNISFLFREAKRYDNPNIKLSNVWDFAKNLCEIEYLTRIAFPLFSKYMRKKHKGNEIIKYAVYDCPKRRFDQLEAIKELDRMFYLEDLEDRKDKRLELENKKRLTPDEASERVINTNSLIQEKSFIANIEFERKIKGKLKEKLNENQQTADQIKQKRIMDIKNGIICPSKATQKHLTKMKNQITKYTSGRHMGQEVNWLDRHYENCKVRFEDHPPE